MTDSTYDNINNITNEMEVAEDGFSSTMLIFAAIMTTLIMIVGIFGNFLTVAALIKCPKVRNVAAAFIMSLCIADLLFCALVLPFSAFRFFKGTWEPGEVLCKIIPFIQYGNIGVSLLCIAMITINRYVMIAHHSSYAKIYKRHWIAAMIIFCWVFSYGMQLPTLVGAWGTFGYDDKLGTCSILADVHGNSSKTTLFITAFLIPCLIIIACYTKIFWVVHKSEQRMQRHANKQNSIPNNLRATPLTASNAETVNGQSRISSADSSSFSTDVKHESVLKQATSRIKDQREVRAKRNEWRITKMVLAIFLSFLVCYLPITIAKVTDQNVEHPNFQILSYIMLYMSACINPIIYVIMNKQYRKAYKTVIMCRPSRLLPFGKHAAGGGGNNGANGSSAAEKWKDTGLSHNHSRTMVSAVDQQNTSFSSSVQLPAMELSPKTGIQTKNDNATNIPMESAPTVPMPVSAPVVPTAMPLPVSTQNLSEPKMQMQLAETNEPKPALVQSSKNNNQPVSNGIVNPAQTIITTRPSNNRIALVGGDIILEEEEVEEEEEVKKPTTVGLERDQTNSERLTPPAIPTTVAPQRPTPVYVNASVLHQKKNPSYGQNINVIPDNKNSTKLLTKTKL